MNAVKESEEWLRKNGFTVMQRSSDNTWGNFTSINSKCSIEVFLKNGEVFCKATGFIGNTFNTVQSMEYKIKNDNIFFQIGRLNKLLDLYDDFF